MSIQRYFADKAELIERHLEILIPDRSLPPLLHQSTSYCLLGAGKRLRPILALATAEILGGLLDNVLTPACTLEMIHTYSLIHDDLPCMDNDDFRRGKPTLHRQFAEGHAELGL